MNKLIHVFKKFEHSKIAILGFGREGKSTLEFLEQLNHLLIGIFDKNPINNEATIHSKHTITFQTGVNYLNNINDYDLIIKSPGVMLPKEMEHLLGNKLTSQTALFLESYHQQIIGITGTKGKSTTSKLIEHLLKSDGKDVILAGNIGIPPFSINNLIKKDTTIVYELSAHQLKKISVSPHISILLNIFPEHLDYFGDIRHYTDAKFHIGTAQQEKDTFIFNIENSYIYQFCENHHFPGKIIEVTSQGSHQLKLHDHSIELPQHVFLKDETIQLKGKHNLLNIIFALEAVKCCGIDYKQSIKYIHSFQPLEHRLEYVGCFHNKHFYNDSIATVPEATIAAINSIGNVNTLILGGMDRGIDYSKLIEKLLENKIKNVLFTGNAGERMMKELKDNQIQLPFKAYFSNDWKDLVTKAIALTPENGTCLLSPAAASYGQFKDFEERGKFFKENIISF